ncbi:MAG: PepSY-associated TM helix domain-containing protein [Balneolaceae bacterium]
MQSKTIRKWFWIHKWSSLVSMIFLLLLCLTGLPLIFHHEIDHALGNTVEAPEDVDAEGRVSVDSVVQDAIERSSNEEMQFLVAEPDEPNLWYVRLGESVNGEISSFYTYDARTGELLNDYPLGQGIMNTILRLHVDMFAGLPGTLFLGGMGLLLVVSIISGVVLYAPFMRKLTFGIVRRNRSARLKWLDMHNVTGIVTLTWLFVVGVTGVINTLSIPIFERWQSTELAKMTEPYSDRPELNETDLASIDTILNTARRAEPDKQLSFMAYPGNSFATPHHFVAFMQGKTAWTSKLLKPVLIDGRSGELVESAEFPWYVKVLLLSQPLHFGDYGGMPLKILWAILTLLSIFVLISGLYLWLKSRNQTFEEWLSKQYKKDKREKRSETFVTQNHLSQ